MRRHVYDHEFVHKPANTLIDAVAAIKKLKYNVFADSELYASSQLPSASLPVSAAETRAELTGLTGSMGVVHPMVLAAGWAVDWPIGDLAGGVTFIVDGVEHPARYGLPSAEAVKRLGSSKFFHAGFRCAVPVGELSPGLHMISLKVLTRDRTAVYKSPPRPINIQGPISNQSP
jgi:hypothetical protein